MTKINKLGKSTFVIAILSFLLIAVLAFGGTYAYFSDTASATATDVTMGHLTINNAQLKSEAVKVVEDTYAVPGQTIIDGPATVAVTSNINYYVRVGVSATYEIKRAGHAESGDNTCTTETCADFGKALFTLTFSDSESGSAWTEGNSVTDTETGVTTRYLYVLAPQASTTTSQSIDLTVVINTEIGEKESEHFMDAKITVNITFQAVQADYLIDGSDEGTDLDVNKTLASIADAEKAWKAAGYEVGTASNEG